MLHDFKPEEDGLDKAQRKAEIRRLRDKLTAQQQSVMAAKLPVIVLVEGWDCAGKGHLINELISEMDPRFYRVATYKRVPEDEERYPFLHKFFEPLPENGKFLFMDTGWMEDCVYKYLRREITAEEYERRVDACNIFERQLRDNGYVVIKLFLHISRAEQLSRIAALRENQDTEWRVTRDDLWQQKEYNRFRRAYGDFMEDTSESGKWHVLNAEGRKKCLLAGFRAVTETIDEALKNGRYVGKPTDTRFPLLGKPSLRDADLSKSVTPEEYKTELKRLQKRLAALHNTIYRKRIPVVICFEGWDAAGKGGSDLLYGKEIKGRVIPVSELNLKMGMAVVEGRVFGMECYETRRKGMWTLNFNITDEHGSVAVRKAMDEKEAKVLGDAVRDGMWLRVQGKPALTFDGKDVQLQPVSIMRASHTGRKDTAPEKRVELHLHTQMSTMDALTDVGKVVAQAAAWGHPAIAVTDHGTVQAFPKARDAGKKGKIKILYGVEGYFVNNLDDRIAVHGAQDQSFADEIVCFDIETTGLKVEREAITEIGAVVLKNGEITERFQTFVNPNRRLTPEIIGLTGITDAMLADAPQLKDALTAFLQFVNGRPLAAHTATPESSSRRAASKNRGLISVSPFCSRVPSMSRKISLGMKNLRFEWVGEIAFIITLCFALGHPAQNCPKDRPFGEKCTKTLTRCCEKCTFG